MSEMQNIMEERDALEALRRKMHDTIAHYRRGLEDIARHPCLAADKERPDWDCGECATCVAKRTLDEAP